LRGTVHADLLLLDMHGKQLACACDGVSSTSIVQRVPPGSYLAVIRARPGETGTYTLALRLRDPTTTAVRLTPAGDERPQLAVAAKVSPAAAGGRLVLELERFDPLTDWHFATTVTHSVASGSAAFSVVPKLGGWRVRVRYTGTLTSSPSVSDWIEFTVDATSAPTTKRRARGPSCSPHTAATFAVGGLAVSCLATALGSAEPKAPPAKTTAAQLRELKATVSGIALLKDPFESELLADLDDAVAAIGNKKPDDARAKLEDFIATVQSAPLQAQLTADQRDQLVETAKRIDGALGR
jgi:hypothetical protein